VTGSLLPTLHAVLMCSEFCFVFADAFANALAPSLLPVQRCWLGW
jgi:hypothetical protein